MEIMEIENTAKTNKFLEVIPEKSRRLLVCYQKEMSLHLH